MKQSPMFIFAQEHGWMAAGEGVDRKVLGFGPDLMMMHVKFHKGAVGYTHKHPHRQVSYIVSGSFDVTIGGETKTLHMGDCYYVPADIEHGVVALEEASLVDVFTPCRDDIIAAHFKTGN